MHVLTTEPGLDYRLVGFLRDQGRGDIGRFQCLGGAGELPELARRHELDEVIVALHSQAHTRIPEVTDLCRSAGVSYEEDRIPELAAHGTVQQFYADLIDKALSPASGCREVDKVARFAFTRPFTFQDRTLTHTMKIRRHEITARDDRLIRSLYPRYIEKGAKKGSTAGGSAPGGVAPGKPDRSKHHG